MQLNIGVIFLGQCVCVFGGGLLDKLAVQFYFEDDDPEVSGDNRPVRRKWRNRKRRARAAGRLRFRCCSVPVSDMFSLSPHRNALVLTAVSVSLTCCFSSSLIPDIAPYFGTKTRYEEVNPRLLRDVLSVNRSVLKAPATERCSPVHLTAVIRHGSRYPTVKNIRRIQRLSELVRRESSRGSERWQQDIQSRWENWFTEDMDGESLELFLL